VGGKAFLAILSNSSIFKSPEMINYY